jgi:hypothetical protein
VSCPAGRAVHDSDGITDDGHASVAQRAVWPLTYS